MIFWPEQKVLYVPPSAHGDVKHRDVEHGVIVRRAHLGWFVRFPNSETPMLCREEDLVPEDADGIA